MKADSGAPVVYEFTGEVFGHIIAVDVSGEGCMMPIHGTMDEIRNHLSAREVRLASPNDVLV